MAFWEDRRWHTDLLSSTNTLAVDVMDAKKMKILTSNKYLYSLRALLQSADHLLI